MGKQSARLYYDGKDHKDIFFRGKYHDAMYLGYELLWHKIRKEGYYVFIYVRGSSRPTERMIVAIFDEKTRSVKKVLEVLRNTESDAYNVELMSVTDGKRIYLSTLGEKALIASTIDGIHYGNTNLDYFDNRYMFARGYIHFSYTEENNGVSVKKNCMWGLGTGTGLGGYVIHKYTITSENGIYSVESKSVDTYLTATHTDSDRYEITNNFVTSETGESKIAWHIRYYREKTGEKREAYTVKYYNAETETSGEIVEFNNKCALSYFCCINGVYMFFAEVNTTGEKLGEIISHLYIYYSFDGINYEHSLIEEKRALPGTYMEQPLYILHRMGMYYIYCNSESAGSLNVVRLTTDFKHFSKKYISKELEIDGKAFGIGGFEPFENSSGNYGRVYFCNGEICNPQNGVVGSTKIGNVYIDNMFFRKSSGNKIINLP